MIRGSPDIELVLKTIFYSLAALIRKILFSPLEDESHIYAPPCKKDKVQKFK
jgi:hypothetical protein